MKKLSARKLFGCVSNQHGGSMLIVLLLILILGVLLAATNPDETKMHQQIAGELIAASQAGNLADNLKKLIGTIHLQRDDYLFFSTLSVEENGQREVVAVGAAGQVFTRDKLDNIKKSYGRKLKSLR
ncbi:MAG: hypothetical protein CSB24_06465 [Deltaproteobacteria bacterium]|nr:MAG: hypothetical protein CSB24_06465 [Deltaproteobacteria bacterium]